MRIEVVPAFHKKEIDVEFENKKEVPRLLFSPRHTLLNGTPF
jgi:hypothetical protein